MLRLNYLILWFLPLLITGFAASVPKAIEIWENNKAETLSNMVETISAHSSGDVTIVASQNIHNEDGSLKEIRTVELIVPNVIYKRRDSMPPEDYLEKLKKNDEELEDTLLKMQKDFRETFEHERIDRLAGFQKLSKFGKVELEIYVTKDETLYQDIEGVAYYDKENITSTDKLKLAKEMKDYFEKSPNTTIISALVWDENGKFDSEHSKVEPMLLGYIVEASDSADEPMMDAALSALIESALKHPDGVAQQITEIMSKKYPDYTWFVIHRQKEDASSAKYDVLIKVTYDNVDLGEDFLEYSIYGVKK